jgi:hypothetical protein
MSRRRRRAILGLLVVAVGATAGATVGQGAAAGSSGPQPFAAYLTAPTTKVSSAKILEVAQAEASRAGDANATMSIGSGTLADAMVSIDSSTKLPTTSEPGEEAMFATPVSLVVMHGSFKLVDAPVPTGDKAPAGNVLDLVINEHTGDVMGRALPSPAQLATSVPLANTAPVK